MDYTKHLTPFQFGQTFNPVVSGQQVRNWIKRGAVEATLIAGNYIIAPDAVVKRGKAGRPKSK